MKKVRDIYSRRLGDDTRIMQIERSKFSGIVLSLPGKRLRGLRLEEAGVVIVAPQQRRLSFTEIAAPVEIDNGFSFFSISLPITDGAKVRVSGIKEGGVR